MPSLLRGVLATLLLVLNTLFWCSLVFLGALVKLLLPFEPVRRRIDPAQLFRQRLGGVQQRLDAPHAAHALGRGRR